jgi:hypothetical protein
MHRAALLAVLVLLACGAGPEDLLDEARDHLAARDYPAAADAATRGLAAGAEGATAWRLELAGGHGAEARARLERLAETRSAQVQPPLYVQTAGQLKEAGDAAGAVDVLDAGAKRFPGDAAIAQAIERSKATADPAELERLRTLGYVQ